MDPIALEQSLVLGAAGMAVLFAFMGGLIALIHFYIKFATRVFPDREKKPSAEGPATEPEERAESGSPEVAAAVAAAAREKEA